MRRIAAACFIVALAGCDTGNEKGESLGLPFVKPPVDRNTPAGIIASSAGLLLASSAINTLTSRLFTTGPTSITGRLDGIDMRLKEFDTRAKESKKACLNDGAKEWPLPAALPGGVAFPVYLQCLDEFSSQGSGFQIAFGQKDGYAYLVELQKRGEAGSTAPQVATLVRAKMDGTATDAWITMQGFDQSQSAAAENYFFFAVHADDATKGFEIAVGGNGRGIGVDCGVQLRSDGANLYANGIFASYGDSGNETCSGAVAPVSDLCLDATTLAAKDDATACASIKAFTLPQVTHLGLGDTGKDASDKFIAATISGYTNFNTNE